MEERKVRKFDPKIQVSIQFMQIVPSVAIMNAISSLYTKKNLHLIQVTEFLPIVNTKVSKPSQKFEVYIYFNHSVT